MAIKFFGKIANNLEISLIKFNDIEKYIGSSGNDDLTLNNLIINDVSTGAGDDVETCY